MKRKGKTQINHVLDLWHFLRTIKVQVDKDDDENGSKK
jgi:hypothetical protein